MRQRWQAARAGRLDRVLADALGVSRGAVRRLLAGGRVTVKGRVAGASDKGLAVAAGDAIEVAGEPDPADQRPIADVGVALSVLASGETWAVVDKPAGTAVHPLRPGERGTVVNAAVARWPGMLSAVTADEPDGLRCGVVHRLDVDTSGALLLGLTADAVGRLRAAFHGHRVTKTYAAVVAGSPPVEGEARLHLRVAQHRPARVAVVDKPGADTRQCDLRWAVVERLGGASVVRVDLGTGFLHQVRAMLAHLGHPLLGDRAYADDEAIAHAAARQMLHAERLRFEEIDASAPWPADFEAVVNGLRR